MTNASLHRQIQKMLITSWKKIDTTDELYAMATTRRGRFIQDSKPYDHPEHAKKKKTPRMVKSELWDVREEMGRLVVEYHMTNTLWD